MVWGALSYLELQESMEINNQGAPAPSSYESSWFTPHQIQDVFSLGANQLQPFDQPVVLLDSRRDQSINYFTGNTEYQNVQHVLTEIGIDKTEQVWQRIRWTDEMVKILITAVSYVGDSITDGPESERTHLPIKGKWRAISNTMVERGYIVSPQQCEDKFNDLNKKYKRLNDLLGRGTSCNIVGDPTMIDMMNMCDEAKEEIKKILTCKQLFYHEMCSFHNKSREHLPHDVLIQQSVRSGLTGNVKCGPQQVILGKPAKRRKNGDTYLPQKEVIDLINFEAEAVEGALDLNQCIVSPKLGLKEKKVQIEKEMLELETKKFAWRKLCQEEDSKLNKMKLENELMKIENKRLEFRCRERGTMRPV